MKRCPQCTLTLPETAYHRNREQSDGLASMCKECKNRAYLRRAREARAYSRSHYQRTREKRRARAREQRRGVKRPRYPKTYKELARIALREAVKAGRIIRPNQCEDCGTTEKPIQAHHADYSKPFDVDWLCAPCHGKRHWIDQPISGLSGANEETPQ
jgi:hypothetical protein